MYTILVVEDNPRLVDVLQDLLEAQGYRVLRAYDGVQALARIERDSIDIVFLDLRLPRLDGMEVLRILRQKYPHLPVIVISGEAKVQEAADAIKMGAYDFLEKPVSTDRIRVVVRNALEKIQLERQVGALIQDGLGRYQMIGESERMKEIFRQIEKVAPTNSRVLIEGETGTGKELVALAIHRLSRRNHRSLVKLNCAAIQDTLAESELFGHKKGSFTGAVEDKEGLFQKANGGTLFLDEISEMSPLIQAKVLRAMDDGEVIKVGGDEVEKVDVRILAATNRDLERQVEKGSFREDLFYRLSVQTIVIPPLREHKEDIPLLAEYYLRYFCDQNNVRLKELTPSALEVMMNHDWPGNIRELRNVMERLTVSTSGDKITAEEAYNAIHRQTFHLVGLRGQTFHEICQEFERSLLLSYLERYESVGEVARALGMARPYLYRKLQKLGIPLTKREKTSKKPEGPTS